MSVDTGQLGRGIVLTDDLRRNTSPAGQAFLAHQLRTAVAKTADELLFSRLTESGMLTTTADGTTDSIMGGHGTALTTVLSRASDRAYVVFGVKAAAWLSAMPDLPDAAYPAGGTFMKRPAIVSEAVAPWSIAVVSVSGAAASRSCLAG